MLRHASSPILTGWFITWCEREKGSLWQSAWLIILVIRSNIYETGSSLRGFFLSGNVLINWLLWQRWRCSVTKGDDSAWCNWERRTFLGGQLVAHKSLTRQRCSRQHLFSQCLQVQILNIDMYWSARASVLLYLVIFVKQNINLLNSILVIIDYILYYLVSSITSLLSIMNADS